MKVKIHCKFAKTLLCNHMRHVQFGLALFQVRPTTQMIKRGLYLPACGKERSQMEAGGKYGSVRLMQIVPEPNSQGLATVFANISIHEEPIVPGPAKPQRIYPHSQHKASHSTQLD